MSTLSGPGTSSRIRPVVRDDRRRADCKCPVSCCLSAAGIGFSGHPLPTGGLGLPCGRLTGARHRVRTPSGLPRSTCTRCDRGGCLLYLGGGGAHPVDKKSPTGACRFTAASPSTSPTTSHQARLTHNKTSTEVHAIHPSGLPLARDLWMEQGSFGFPLGFAPRCYQRRTPRAGPGLRARAWDYASGIGRASDLRARSLRATSCRSFFLVSTLMTGSPAFMNSLTRSFK